MRISYSDDEEYPGQFELWQANCRRSLKGRKGQIALQELETALLALPEKRLIANALQNEDGDVCAIGAVCRLRNYTPKADPEEEMEAVGMEIGMPELVAWKVVEKNDVDLERHYVNGKMVEYTPEERYERMLAWVRRMLGKAEV